jgi:hypothetical protein
MQMLSRLILLKDHRKILCIPWINWSMNQQVDTDVKIEAKADKNRRKSL